MADLAFTQALKTEVANIRELMIKHGHRRFFRKNGYFCLANSPNPDIAYIVKGGFKYCCYDYQGKEQVLTLAFDGELIGSYLAWQSNKRSIYDIQATEDSEVYSLNITELNALLSTFNLEILRAQFAEIIAFEILQKTISMRCESPEQRYLQLLIRVPDILKRTTLRNIASYLSISPEALSRMRTRMLKNE